MPSTDIIIRQAAPDDAPGIAVISQASWRSGAMDVAHCIAAAIDDVRHAVHVAVSGTRLVGFVDGFKTHNNSCCARWEVDLLAVDPEFRGQGFGERLVHASTVTGYKREAAIVRGLVRIDNTAGQRTFARCSYQKQPQVLELYVTSPGCRQLEAIAAFARGWAHIPVSTFNYKGVWLEPSEDERVCNPEINPRDFEHDTIVGILLAKEDVTNQLDAQAAGFRAAGKFQWWHHKRVNSNEQI